VLFPVPALVGVPVEVFGVAGEFDDAVVILIGSLEDVVAVSCGFEVFSSGVPKTSLETELLGFSDTVPSVSLFVWDFSDC